MSQTRPPRSIACGSATTTRMSSPFLRAPSRGGVLMSFGLRVTTRSCLGLLQHYCHRTGPASLGGWYEGIPPNPPSDPFRPPSGDAMNWSEGGDGHEDPDRRGPVAPFGAGGAVRDPDAVAGREPGDRGERDDAA